MAVLRGVFARSMIPKLIRWRWMMHLHQLNTRFNTKREVQRSVTTNHALTGLCSHSQDARLPTFPLASYCTASQPFLSVTRPLAREQTSSTSRHCSSSTLPVRRCVTCLLKALPHVSRRVSTNPTVKPSGARPGTRRVPTSNFKSTD
jgi:hypothetical protein